MSGLDESANFEKNRPRVFVSVGSPIFVPVPENYQFQCDFKPFASTYLNLIKSSAPLLSLFMLQMKLKLLSF